jgi:hypothetical protein
MRVGYRPRSRDGNAGGCPGEHRHGCHRAADTAAAVPLARLQVVPTFSCQDVPVRFTAEHRFAAPVDSVVAGLTDPAFHRELQLPDLKLLDVDAHTNRSEAVVRLRYDFVGHLDPLARRLLGDRRLTWVQELRLDRARAAGPLSFEAEADPRRLHGRADVALVADGGGTRRTVDGELVVAVPVVGRSAERRIVPGLLRRLDIEAAALDERLRSG